MTLRRVLNDHGLTDITLLKGFSNTDCPLESTCKCALHAAKESFLTNEDIYSVGRNCTLHIAWHYIAAWTSNIQECKATAKNTWPTDCFYSKFGTASDAAAALGFYIAPRELGVIPRVVGICITGVWDFSMVLQLIYIQGGVSTLSK